MNHALVRAALALVRRWRRNLLSLCAVLFCAATFVVLQGVTLASTDRTAQRFVDMEPSTVTATLPASAWERDEGELLAALCGIPQVRSAGTLVMGDAVGVPVDVAAWGGSIDTTVAVGTAAGVAARGGSVDAGLPMADGDVDVVMLGARIASELGVTGAQEGQVVEVNGRTMRVAGILSDAPDQSALATGVLVTPAGARAMGILPVNRVLQVAVEEGTAPQVAGLLPMALVPAAPESVSVKLPADPRALRMGLMADAEQATLVITVVMVVVSVFTVVNTMQVAVTERRREIGISLGLGMPAWQVAFQFLLESLLLGCAGALAGLTLGAQVTAVVAMTMGWRFLLPATVAWVPLAGAFVGAVGGMVPAAQATRVDPAELLRSM